MCGLLPNGSTQGERLPPITPWEILWKWIKAKLTRPHDDGKCDLAVLWQAVIDNTKGNGFWLGEILLDTIRRETGFDGSAHTRPHRDTPGSQHPSQERS